MRLADLEAVMQVAGSLEFAPRWGVEAFAAALSLERIPKRVALVAEGEAGQVIGFVVGMVIAPEAELESIGVCLDAQRRGVGKALLESWRKGVGTAGAEEIVLEVRASNLAARLLYSRAGFTVVGCRARYYSGPVEDAILFCSKVN